MNFFNILKPQRTFGEEEFKVTKLNSREAFGSVVETKNYKETFVYNTSNEKIEIEGIKTDARWIIVVEKDGKIEKVGVHKGTYLNFNGKLLVEENIEENLFI